MTEEKRTIHVLKDEKLGVDREYVAVDRNAEVGEKIVITKAEYNEGEIYEIGHYGKVYIANGEGEVSVDFIGFDNSFVDDDGKWFVGDGECSDYHVLEPTDIVHIDGERYRMEDRKAEVGEKIIVNKSYDMPIGHISVVKGNDVMYDDGSCYLEDELGREDYFDGESDQLLVLTPVQDDAEPKESDVITVLANLGAEVAELKRTAARHQAEINALHEDKVRLGEQLATLTADIGIQTGLSGSFIAELLIGLKKAGL
ncbi:hypothetical protein NSS78_16215 [Bacillus sp. FSL W8-0920]|uniref:hypothetical protein n=1 Tax=Bacillus sp. FSL W8-0920 TaxID=2954636 RepID=UPI003158055B